MHMTKLTDLNLHNWHREEISFSVTKNKKMFEDTIRRVRVLNDLLKEKKILLETSIECSLPIFERCYENNLRRGKTINFFGAGKRLLIV